ncbi:hypothetical protein [Muriicola soli]|uniref:Uncharacterized protein n=1 Tax=Muriicola soli TaxID=2507538 RepID=A0A411E9Y8_9FLAO|nr:hypothetical protein [Muriicola soli]QBA64458.1 hypothetical protein EQY75_07935 [Muriicola soli]
MKDISKENSFKTPPGYFEGLSDQILKKIQEEDTGKLPKKEGFGVPENYFDQLEKDILTKTVQKETPVIKLKQYKSYFYAAAAIAAIFILVIGLEWNTTQTLNFDDLAEADITSYIESRDLELSNSEIAEVIPLANLEMDDFMESSVDSEQIMDYLEDSINDLDELNIDLNEEYQ